MKENSFERELPQGYRLALKVDAKSKKFGIIFNLIALLIFIVVMAAAVFFLVIGKKTFEIPERFFVAWFIFMVSMIAYIVLHELVHGLVYKIFTGEKLTFGLSWSCAFCGVPNIFTYRRTALFAVSAPLIVFTLIFIPVLVMTYCLSPLYFLLSSIIFGLHLGGCSGDMYIMYLFLFRYKDKNALMNDTGPVMTLYVPE